jgi:hypothetical protein
VPSESDAEAHRRDLLALTALAIADLDVLFRRAGSADEARDLLAGVLPELVAVYGAAAATLAADWYDEVRDADGVPGRFRAIPADLPDRGRTDSLAGWAVGPLFSAVPDFAAAKEKAAGGLHRIVADAGRQTVIRSVGADPRGAGWSRRVSGESCDFCRMIAGRGAVYSASTADFSSHDHCDCAAVPVFGAVRGVRPYTPSQRRRP